MTDVIRNAATAAHSALNAVLLASMLVASSPSMAQTCAAPAVWPAINVPTPMTTCGGEHVADSFCGGNFQNPGPNYLVRFRLDHNATQIMLTGADGGFDPVMYLSDAAHSCDSGECLAAGSQGAPINLAGLPSGEYWLTVAANDQDEPGACGSFVLTADGDLSGDDFIFADGFD